jgi:hypothetical protein
MSLDTKRALEKVDRSHLIHEAKMHLLGLNADEILELMSNVLLEKAEPISPFLPEPSADPEVQKAMAKLLFGRMIGGN